MGFLSSDRESVCCLELYSFVQGNLKFAVAGNITDCDTAGSALEGVKVSLYNASTSELINEVTTDEDGSYLLDLNADVARYKLLLEKKGYYTKEHFIQLEENDTRSDPVETTLCITPLVPDKPIVISNIYYDFDKATLRDRQSTRLNS